MSRAGRHGAVRRMRPFDRFLTFLKFRFTPKLTTRLLTEHDIPALLALEHEKWDDDQSADAGMLLQRIKTYPELCIGSFCRVTNKMQASTFLRPIRPAIFTAPTKWEVAAQVGHDKGVHDYSDSMFGISLSSNNAEAADEILKYLYARALKFGWRDIYLGSPIPGFKKALEKNSDLSVWEYVHGKQKAHPERPLDPQLAYYFKKGFKQIVSIQADYFPHAPSLDYGVIVRCVIPLARPRALWQATPLAILEPVSSVMLELVG